MKQIELFFLALSFYTRIPTPKNLNYQNLSEAGIYLPVIGWLVGGLSGLGFYLANLVWQQNIAVIIALIVGVLLTGAFHEDGFADVCDGFGGGYDKQHILEIMKDSQIGAYGALGLILLLLLKINLLSQLPVDKLPIILLAAHSLSRFSPLLTMHKYNYARNEVSKSGAAVFRPTKAKLALASVAGCLPLTLLPSVCSVSIVFILVSNWQLGRYFDKYIGGYTGDCLGACQQIAEVIFYLSLSALWTFT